MTYPNIGLALLLPLPITLLKRLMRDRHFSADEKVVLVGVVTAAAGNEELEVNEPDLAEQLGLSPRSLRDALGALWARGYLRHLVPAEEDGYLQIGLWPDDPPIAELPDGGEDT